MSRLKIALVALTVFISGIAFAGDKKSEAKNTEKAKSGTVLYWFDASTGAYTATNTIDDESSRTGCALGGDDCERGYTQSQLNNPNDPSQGVKSTQINTPQGELQHTTN